MEDELRKSLTDFTNAKKNSRNYKSRNNNNQESSTKLNTFKSGEENFKAN